MLRNRRTVIFTLVMPAAFFFMFGSGSDRPRGRANVTAYLCQPRRLRRDDRDDQRRRDRSSIERAQGWSRQLRLTPLHPVAYIATKVITAMVARPRVGGRRLRDRRRRRRPASRLTQWIVCGLVAWLGALVFAAFGLFTGYLLPSENVMQILGPVLAILAFAGGLFVPLQFLEPDRADGRQVHAGLRRRRSSPASR